jgi:hypothetical protein
MKYIKTYEDRYLTDDEIESSYDDVLITKIMVEKIFDDGGASGTIEFDDYSADNWIKYDSGPKIAFDKWYPEKKNIEIKAKIEKEIKKEKLRRDAEKYNL